METSNSNENGFLIKCRASVLNDKYTILKELGRGLTSYVYLASCKNQKNVAIKIFQPKFINTGKAAKNIFINELKALGNLDHKNIVQSFDYGITGEIISEDSHQTGVWFIVLEYVSNQTLVDLMAEFKRINEKLAQYFFDQMINALTYISANNICHRDLKLENMLLDDNYILKFTDFGFASFSSEFLTQYVGSSIYMAPEMQLNIPYKGSEVDVFSLGVVLFSLIAGIFPFKIAHITDSKYKLIIEEKYEQFWKQSKVEDNFSKECKELIIKMLQYNPEERIKISSIMEDEWFQKNGSGIISQDEAKQIIEDKKLAIARAKQQAFIQQKSRGNMLTTGDLGSTTYFDSNLEYSIHKVNQNLHNYNYDGTELKLYQQAMPTDVIEQIIKFIEATNATKQLKIKENLQKQDKTINSYDSVAWKFEIEYDNQNQLQNIEIKKRSMKIYVPNKDLELRVMFLAYVSEEKLDDNQNVSYSQLYVKFDRIKGPLLNFYNCIAKIKEHFKGGQILCLY